MLHNLLNKVFHLGENNTNIKTELTAGITTFLSSAYILFVNPSILSQSGMDVKAVFLATALSIILGCFLMAFLANLPVIVSPGMGANSWFAFTVVLSLGFTWQQALAAVFIGGILFILFTITKLRFYLIGAFSPSLKFSIGAGIGLFIAFIGLKSGGIIIASPAIFIAIGHPFSLPFLMTLFGLLFIIVLERFRIKGSLLISIAVLSVVGLFFNESSFTGIVSLPPSLKPTFLQLDFSKILEIGFIAVALSVFLIDFLDSTGTFVSLVPSLKNVTDQSPRVKRGFLVDGIATVFGSLVGTSMLAPYIESSTGIKAGGRTGLTAFFIAILFAIALFLSPLLTLVPSWATAPILIYVGSLMFKNVMKIEWENNAESIPAFLTIFLMPLTSSIGHGIGIGILSWLVLNIFYNKFSLKKHYMLLVISICYIIMLCNL